MFNTFVYNSGKDAVIFQRSHKGALAVHCTIIGTRASVLLRDNGIYEVLLPLFVTNFLKYCFGEWLTDWTDADNFGRQQDNGENNDEKWDYQNGRLVYVAVPSTDLEGIIQTRQLPSGRRRHHGSFGPIQSPVAAVWVNGKWIEPLPFI